jgi:hypothetical protein
MIDFVGPFQPARSHRFRYALQIQDVFSRFLIFEPTIDCTAPTAAEMLTKRWISIFGMPSTLRSDRGSHFTAEVFEEVCRLSGIKHKLGSPEHPQSQGQVERQNQLINQVRCLCENDIEKWPQALFNVQCSHNGAQNSSTGFSPGRILLGKGFQHPEDILFKQGWYKAGNEFLGTRVKTREEEDDEIYSQVTSRISKSQEKRAQSLKSNGSPYKVGDRVRYKLNDDTRSKKGGKIAPRYSEEYEVIEVLGDGYTYNLRAVNHNGRAKSRHFNMLKTVRRSEDSDSSDIRDNVNDRATVLPYNRSADIECPDIDSPSMDGNITLPDAQHIQEPTPWVRRSTRARKEVQRLQADGTKKTYSSSKAIDVDDSD